MKEFILFMHDDVPLGGDGGDGASWESYLATLRASGAFEGGSSIGEGVCVRKAGIASAPSGITGFVRVRAENLEEALRHLDGNPDYESGGTIEIRELAKD
ncbi:MAG: hypothetical protein IT348_03935 [Candidatus Eisenbacteria bacterium]|nr:hypothetical protein [Candidatus Eisenbacteria bacterium]